VGALVLIASISVIFLKRIGKGSNYSVTIIALSILDIFQASSVIILAGVDLHYEKSFVFKDFDWRSGIGCQVISIFIDTCQRYSFILYAFIASDRYHAVLFPIEVMTHGNKIGRRMAFLFILLCLNISYSAAIVLLSDAFQHGMPTQLCMFVEFYNGWADFPIWRNSSIFNCMIALICSVFCMQRYIVVMREIKSSNAEIKKTKQVSLIKMYVRLIIVITANLIYTLFMIENFVAQLSGSEDVITISILCAVLFQSIMNSKLFTLSTNVLVSCRLQCMSSGQGR